MRYRADCLTNSRLTERRDQSKKTEYYDIATARKGADPGKYRSIMLYGVILNRTRWRGRLRTVIFSLLSLIL
jgi:hypothetical protein